MPNLTNSQEPEPVFWPLGAWAGAARKKIPGAGANLEINQEPELEPLEKKSGAGDAKKFAGSPALIRVNINMFTSYLSRILTGFLIRSATDKHLHDIKIK